MSIQRNQFAEVPAESQITESAATFIESTGFESIPDEAILIGKRCLLDGLGLYVAGSDHETAVILAKLAAEQGEQKKRNYWDTRVPGCQPRRPPGSWEQQVMPMTGMIHRSAKTPIMSMVC